MSSNTCCACNELYPLKSPSLRAPLGTAPNKYCYRERCKQLGIQRGHIRPSDKRPAPPIAGTSNLNGDGVENMTMAREPTPFGASQLFDIEAVYGFRHACWPCVLPCLWPALVDPSPELTPVQGY